MHTKNYFLSFMVAFVFCWTNLAAQEQPFTYVVATDNSGDFTTVQAAVDACKEGEQRSIIFIKNGTYKEIGRVVLHHLPRHLRPCRRRVRHLLQKDGRQLRRGARALPRAEPPVALAAPSWQVTQPARRNPRS